MDQFAKTENTSTVPEIPSISEKHDGEFRRLTKLGLAASIDQDRCAARRYFEEARKRAEAVFEVASREGGSAALVAPMILAISCQNTASERCLLNDEEGAIEDLAYAVERLRRTAAANDVPLDMRLNCIRHLRHALGALAALRQVDQPMLDDVARIVSQVVQIARVYAASRPDAAGNTTRH